MRTAVLFGMALCLVGASACAEGELEPGALEVIALTRTTTATYSVYTWNILAPMEAARSEEWSAEFHDGNLHRVETPRDRIVADCEAGTGAHLNVATGEIVRGAQVARAACGVQANSAILSASAEPEGRGPFGKTRRISVQDSRNLRTYEIAANGAIVGATIADLDGNLLLDARAMALLDHVPAEIFSEASLASSAVPGQFREPLTD